MDETESSVKTVSEKLTNITTRFLITPLTCGASEGKLKDKPSNCFKCFK